jgi:hypothetical protein
MTDAATPRSDRRWACALLVWAAVGVHVEAFRAVNRPAPVPAAAARDAAPAPPPAKDHAR